MHPLLITKPVDVDPLLAARGLADRPGTVLLHDQTRDAASILFFDPRWICRFDANGARWSGDVPQPAPPPGSPLRWPLLIQAAWPRRPRRGRCGGLAGWIGYDVGPALWKARHREAPPFALPDAWFGAYDLALVFGPSRVELVATDLAPWVPAGISLEDRWQAGLDRLRAAAARPAPPAQASVSRIESFDRAWHARAIETIRHHLRSGNIYQANLTGFATARTDVDPWSAFVEQARVNPVSHAAYLHTGDAVLTSHSPERLLWMRGGRCLTSPIKGTARAGEADYESLRASVKDRAEHVMIVDLCRHDLGRVCEYGSVRAAALMAELRVQGLVHLVSHVEGRLRPGRRREVLESLFPGGSITGAPKRRAQEIISQVEASGRGPYTGSIGFVDAAGRAEWNIAIRTAVWQNDGVAFGCGGGIVLDSDPAQEYEEAQLKAASFFATLQRLGERAPLAARAGGL